MTYRKKPAHLLRANEQEVTLLFQEAKAFFTAGKLGLAKRRVKAARRVAMKVHLRLPTFWHRYCRSCSSYLEQGKNSTIRIKKKIRILHCQDCGYVRRKILR